MSQLAERYIRRHTGLGDAFTDNWGAARAAAAGVAVQHVEYPVGAPGVRRSLTEMARLMREARLDPAIGGYCADVLKAAGIDGRNRAGWTARAVTQALLDNVRQVVIYAPDAVAAEVITSPAGQLCLRPNLCIRKEDCIPAGTLLLRDDYELVPIEQIKVGDRIWGKDKWTRVEATEFKGQLMVDAIEMNNGSTMYLTPDHKVYTGRCRHGKSVECATCYAAKRTETFERVPVGDLQEGETLLQPEKIDFGTVEAQDLDVAYIDGLYISEGWNDGYRFCVSGQDGSRKEALKHEIKAACDRLGIATSSHRKYIRINDAAWAQRLAPRGTRARFKNIETLNLNEATAAAILRGVMSDSTLSAPNKRSTARTYSTTSYKLAVQVRVLHRMFGQPMGYKMLTPEQHGGAGKHPLWRLGQYGTGEQKAGRTLVVRSIERAVRKVPCWDIQTEDHYVYLPEHDVTVSNCDGLTTLLGAMVMSVGFRAWIVKQSWGPSAQEHVLLAVEDEDGNKLLADPSHASLPVGRGVAAHSQEFYDPLDADCAVNVGAGNAELVTFGALPAGVAAYGGGHGHSAHGGGAQRPMHGGDGSMRRYQNGRWVSWNGMSWVPAGNIGCLQWGAPLAQPSAALRAYANSIGADNMPIITTYGGTQYLFAIKNSALVIRPCTGTVGMGAAAVNDQLAPRRRATGMGASYSADQIKSQLLEVSGIMDQAEAAVASADAAGCLPQSSVLQFRLFYAGWITTRDALSACLADTLPSVDTSCSPFYSFPGDWSQAQATLTGYANAVQGTGTPPTGGWQQTIANACTWYKPPPQHQTPVVPPTPSPSDLLDKAKSTAMVVGGVIVVGTLAYLAFEAVQIGRAVTGAVR